MLRPSMVNSNEDHFYNGKRRCSYEDNEV